MKSSSYFFVFFYCLPIAIFAQGNMTEKLDEIWNPDAGTWDFQQVDNWQYDEQDRVIFHVHEDNFINDFTLEDRRSIKREYDANGNLILEIHRSFSDTTWREYQSNHQYDNQNRLVETLNKQTHSYDLDYFFMNRIEYDYNDIENKITERTYTFYVGSSEWAFNHGNIRTFDDNDCLLEQEEIGYLATGEIYSKQTQVWTRDADCRPLTKVFSLLNQNNNELELRDKDIYSYSNDGKKIVRTNQQYNQTTNEWDPYWFSETEFDERSRLIRAYHEYFIWELADKSLHLYTYTDKDEQATSHQYRTYKSIGIEELTLTAVDSAFFEYNDEEQLVYRKRFSEYYYHQANPTFTSQFKSSTRFAYYCDGQLKSETNESLPNVYRTTYEYDKGGDCHLENNDLQMVIFPNPSDGNIKVQSNLLAFPNAEIRIFSTLGQEVYYQKLGDISERTTLNLNYLPNGNYIISIIDGKSIISKKIHILK